MHAAFDFIARFLGKHSSLDIENSVRSFPHWLFFFLLRWKCFFFHLISFACLLARHSLDLTHTMLLLFQTMIVRSTLRTLIVIIGLNSSFIPPRTKNTLCSSPCKQLLQRCIVNMGIPIINCEAWFFKLDHDCFCQGMLKFSLCVVSVPVVEHTPELTMSTWLHYFFPRTQSTDMHIWFAWNY